MLRYHLMPRTKYIYSVYDIQKKTHIAFFSSLDRALEFTLAHELKVKAWNYQMAQYCSYTDKHRTALPFNTLNEYKHGYIDYEKHYTHLFIKIPLDENGQMKF